jgi:hypothetical protein
LEITASEPPPVSQLSQPTEPPQIVREKTIVGPYQVLYPTSVHGEPREDSVRVANIEAGTRVHVVGVQGEWLEIRSKHGRPPGFIKKGSVVQIEDR